MNKPIDEHADMFVRYYRADLDTEYDLLMLITEYTPLGTLTSYIDQYGFFDETSTGKFYFMTSSS